MTKRGKAVLYISVFVLTAVSMIILCYLRGIVPFGTKGSMAIIDAQIQYLDFFAYFKDVLNGTQKIGYSFNRTLGGGNIAVFSYYLASPFNLLIAFFRKDQIQAFFTIVVILKLAMCSMTCSVFLKNRFKNLESAVVILLSLGYGMMEYNIDQASNIMWLDGVYMLPLILLGVSQLVREDKKALLASASGVALLLNWYTAAIDFLFSAVWFLYEVILITTLEKSNIKKMVLYTVRYCIAMGTALLIGAALFLPSVIAMSDGKGDINWSPILGTYGWGNVFSFIQRFTIGSKSEYGNASFYCGSLAVIGCMICLICKKLEKRKRTLQLTFLAFVLSFFYIPAFTWVFSLMKYVGSYWYRYGYIGTMAFIVIAADIFAFRSESGINGKDMWKAQAAAALVLFFIEYMKPLAKPINLYMTVTAFCFTILFLDVHISCKKKVLKWATMICLVATVSVELIYNGKEILLLDNEVEHFVKYTNEETELVRRITEQDDSFYRIHETSTRSVDDNKLTVNYNESLAYNYHSISSYTSDPDVNQLEFMDKMGYKFSGNVMVVANASVLGADSILGVKYVLSSYAVPGWKKIETIQPENGKSVYYNPYALPVAFTYDSSNILLDPEEKDEFLYQNQIFSYLSGQNVQVNKRIETEPKADTNTVGYDVKHMDDPVYGYFNMKDKDGGRVYVDDQYVTLYNTWISPRVVYIPQQPDTPSTHVHIDGDNMEKRVESACFYYTDLNELEKVTQKIQGRKEDGLLIQDGSITGTVKNPQNLNRLYLSVPYDKGWSVKVNGKKIKPELVGNCMMSLPLENGENTIEMGYHVPGLKAGICLSVVGAAVWAAIWWNERKNNIAEK